MSRKVLVVVALLVAMCTSAFAQSSTSGALTGRVSDNSGPVPGVTVELSSPSIQGGTRVAVTDANGEFRFSLLPPGQYTINATLSGYAPLKQENIAVGLSRTVQLELAMRPSSVTETITVTAEAPLVDVTSAASGANVTSETMETLPMRRDFYAVAQVAPGTSEDAAGTTVYGSTGAENQYIIDGLNTTSVELGIEGKTLNFDFIQEVAIRTGGLPAEYGRVTGGVIEAITKSGGNEFSGDVFGYSSGGGLRSEENTAGQRPGTTTTVADIDSQFDIGFDLGGYILRDKLWFFGAYNRVNETDTFTIIRDLRGAPGTPGIGSSLDQDITRDLYAGKLTWQITRNQNASLSVFGDPSEADGAVFGIAGPPVTFNGNRSTGGNDMTARYSGVFGTNWLVSGIYGQHHEEDYTTGPGKLVPQIINQTVNVGAPVTVENGFGFHQDQEFDRDVMKLDVTRYLGNHELKIGGDIEDLSAYNENWNGGGGQRIYKRGAVAANVPGNPNPTVTRLNGAGQPETLGVYYRHRFYLDDTAPGFDLNNPATWVVAIPLATSPETTNTSAYLQDSWRLRPNLTLNLGVRWEQQEIGDRFGEDALILDDQYAPRVGLIWDVMNNGRSKLFGNYGRFYESIPMDINIRAFGGELQALTNNYSPNPANVAPITAPGLPRTSFLGGSQTPVDPDLKGQYIDEYILGFEYELASRVALGIQGTYRNLGRVVEDFLDPVSGHYHIANPGEGSGVNMAFYDYEPAIAPDVKREFTGVQLHARKRFAGNAQVFASYLWSRLEGNYDGVYQASTGQLDPNINSAFDYADFMINADGLLSNDREHQFKFNGSYMFDNGFAKGLTVGLSTYYSTGYPLNAYGYSPGYQNWEFYLAPRGSVGRAPAEYEADVHLGYPISFGGSRLNLLVDVFNILNRQSATRLDERYNLSTQGGCAGIPDAICGPGGGIHYRATNEVPQPAGVLSNPRATAANPDFLSSATAFTGPRAIRLGLRWSF